MTTRNACHLLRAAGVHVPESTVFGSAEVQRAWAWAEPILPVVVKPNNGMQGAGVFVDIGTFEDFAYAYQEVTRTKGDVLVERFHAGQDHRVLVVDGRVLAATRRIAAHDIGDGSSSITQLVERKNSDRPVIHKKLRLDDTVTRYLARQGLTAESVPAEGETVYLRGTANLHTGGDAMDATDLLTEEQIAQVEQAAKAIPGLRVAGFDLLIPEHDDVASTILEINENPMISMHHFPAIGEPRNVAGAIVEAMFPSVRRSGVTS